MHSSCTSWWLSHHSSQQRSAMTNSAEDKSWNNFENFIKFRKVNNLSVRMWFPTMYFKLPVMTDQRQDCGSSYTSSLPSFKQTTPLRHTSLIQDIFSVHFYKWRLIYLEYLFIIFGRRITNIGVRFRQPLETGFVTKHQKRVSDKNAKTGFWIISLLHFAQ